MSSNLVIVTGGRDYADYGKVRDELKGVNPSFVIEGGAKGADSLARRACDELMIPHVTVWALWGSDGTWNRKAGYDRNLLMAKMMSRLGGNNPQRVLAFPGGKGTQMMVDIAGKFSFPVEDFR